MVEQGSHLPNGWAEVNIGRIGSIRLGRARSPNKQTGRFPTKYLRAANITMHGLDLREVTEMDFTPEERAMFALRADDIVLADSSGSPSQVGRSAIWNNEIPDCCYQNHVIRFRPYAVYPKFALLVFRHYVLSGIFAGVARGIGILHLGASRFAGLPFLLPPWKEQVRIVAETERRIAELRAAERSLQSALERIGEQRLAILAAAASGQLVEAASEGADFNQQETTSRPTSVGSDPALSQLRSLPSGVEPGMESDSTHMQPRLPSHWVSVRVGDVGELKLGRQRSPDKQTGRYSTKYLRAANITQSGLDLREVFEMDFTPAERDVYGLRAGDILLAEASGSASQVGRTAVWQEEIPDCCYQNTVIRFRSEATTPEFALLVFRHYAACGEFERVARGVGIQHLGLSRLAAMSFPLPPISEQRRIADVARSYLDATDASENAIQASLERLPTLEAELLAAAAAGALVSQSEADEPASALLARLGDVPPDQTATNSTAKRAARGDSMAKTRKLTATHVAGTTDLVSVIQEAGHPLSLPELFSLAGYDRDSIDDVERFYLILRDQLGRFIHVVDDGHENATVEAIFDASRRT